MGDICGAFDGMARPFLHRRAVDVLSRMVERDPGNRFIFGYVGFLDQLQRQSLIVKLNRKNGTRWGPRPNHQVMEHPELSRWLLSKHDSPKLTLLLRGA